MDLISVKFTKAHRSYNKGEIAGFSPKIAHDLINVKKVARPHVADEAPGAAKPVSDAETIAADILSKAKEQAEQTLKEAGEQKAALDAREADLNAREAALKKDAAELEKAKAAAKDEPKPAPDTQNTAAAKPPKQGGK